ncbi:MAG: hypothetical protein JWQ49_2025 [Edaphobacter sp.]|nr:hypothetical protein [Edaphobacter sp.]
MSIIDILFQRQYESISFETPVRVFLKSKLTVVISAVPLTTSVSAPASISSALTHRCHPQEWLDRPQLDTDIPRYNLEGRAASLQAAIEGACQLIRRARYSGSLSLFNFCILSSQFAAPATSPLASARRLATISSRNDASMSWRLRSRSAMRPTPGSNGLGELHAGQRLAKPGFLGWSSNGSEQTTQIRVANVIVRSAYSIRDVRALTKKRWVNVMLGIRTRCAYYPIRQRCFRAKRLRLPLGRVIVYLWQYSRPRGTVVFDFRLGRGREQTI